MIRHVLGVLLIAVAPPGAADADDRGREDRVEVGARIAGTDAPAAHVTLFFSRIDQPGQGVATDDAGLVRGPLPADVPRLAGLDGQPGPPCRVLAQEDRAWKWEGLGDDPNRPADFDRRQALNTLLRRAGTRWRVRDGRARLVAECPRMGEVEVAVRGPEGTALVDRAVFVSPAESRLEVEAKAGVRFLGRTDAEGRFRIRWFEGLRRLRVLVPGVGFGSTGTFEVIGGREARPNLPPLARLARIAGTLDGPLAGPGATVHLGPTAWGPRIGEGARADCDEQGRFALEDVFPGTYSLSISRAGKPVLIAPIAVRAEPGGRIEGLVLRPPLPPDPKGRPHEARPPQTPVRPGAEKEALWVEGAIRDEAGHPVPGAAVVARTAFHGGIRMNEDVREATSDAQGRYRLAGSVWPFMDPVAVVVIAHGRPPAVAYAPAFKADGGKRPSLDVTLSDHGGSLNVRVLQRGMPLPGATVSLQVDGVASLTQWARPQGGADRINPRFNPVGRAGDDGVARFRDLFPGTYRVVANDGPKPLDPSSMDFGHGPTPAYGIAEGVGLAAGQVVEQAIAVHPQPCKVRLRVLRPDGAPVRNQSVAFGYGLGRTDSNTSLKLDGQGIGIVNFAAPGLWAVDVRFRETEMHVFPASQEPFDQSEAWLAVSPALACDEPISLRGVRRESGSLRVRLLDVEGRPARGSVWIARGFGLAPSVEYAGTADDGGEVRFAGMPGGSYELRGSIDGVPPPFEPGPTGSYPEDDAPLTGGVAVEGVTAKVDAGGEARAELRARRVGYIRGEIRPPAGHRAEEYHISVDIDRPGAPIPWRRDPATGRLTFGPLPPGARTLKFYRRAVATPWSGAGTQVVDVPPGGVARVDLAPREAPGLAPAASGPATVALGMGGLSVREAEPIGAGGTAWLPDGKAPAFGARALLFRPEHEAPVASGVADGAGVLTWRALWIAAGPEDDGAGRAAKPTAVVWLPGRCGAAVLEVEPDQPLRAVLPAPRVAAGRVTLGGRPMDDRNARVRVVAAHQGRGAMDAALGQEVSTQADGRFELRGLTPGRYRVQAARDGIWLSRSVELRTDAGEGEPAPDLALDIPEPGRPTVVEVVDGRGCPVTDKRLTLPRPEGPLASLRPESVRTDGAGSAPLGWLEVGDHPIRIDGEPAPRLLHVPAAQGDAARPEVVRFVLGPTP